MSNRKFLKNSLIFSAGNFNVILLNYAIIAIMARIFTPAEFGEINTLLAIFRYVLTIGMSVYLAVSHVASHNTESESLSLFKWLEKWLLAIGLVVFALFTVFDTQLQAYFHIERDYIFTILGAVFVTAFLLPLSRGFLAGKKSFKHVTLNSNLEAVVKLAVFGAFWYIGYPFYGVLISVSLGIIVSYLSNRRRIHKQAYAKKATTIQIPKAKIQSFLKHVFWIFLGTGLVTAFYNFDIILIQHFNPDINANYVIITKMAQVIFLVTNSLVVVMFPEIKKNADQLMQKKIYMTLGLTVLISLGALLGFWLLGELALSILFGSDYSILANYLPFAVFIGLFLSMMNVSTHYYLGKKNDHSYMPYLAVGLIGVGVCAAFFSSSLFTVLTAVTIALGMTAIVLFIKTLLDIRAATAEIRDSLPQEDLGFSVEQA